MKPCPDVQLFHDDEMTPAQAAAFRDHLPGCRPCLDELCRLADAHFVGTVMLDRRSEPRVWPVVALVVSLLVMLGVAILLERA